MASRPNILLDLEPAEREVAELALKVLTDADLSDADAEYPRDERTRLLKHYWRGTIPELGKCQRDAGSLVAKKLPRDILAR